MGGSKKRASSRRKKDVTPPPRSPTPPPEEEENEEINVYIGTCANAPANSPQRDTPEDEGEPQAQDLHVEPSQGTPANKRKRKEGLMMSEDKEDNVAQWILANPILYNKARRDYKDAKRKQRMWEQKAKELGVDGKTLFYILLW